LVYRDISLPLNLDVTLSRIHSSDYGSNSYTKVQGLRITPIKLFGCAVLFLGGVIVISISLTRGLALGPIWLLIGVIAAVLGLGLSLPA